MTDEEYKKKLEEIWRKFYEEQMRLHPEIYFKDKEKV